MYELRHLGSFAPLQITPTADDSDLVSRPVEFRAGAHTLQNHGGPTIPRPKLVLLWCGQPAIDRPRFEQFCQELMTYGYLDALTYAGYVPGSGRFLGGFTGPAFPVGQIVLDSQMQTALKGYVAAHGEIPQPDGSTIYSAMLADGVTVQFDGTSDQNCSSFCGYHEAAAPTFLYTVQPSPNCNGCNQGNVFDAACMVEAHEVAETVSDPFGTGWYEDSTGMENADIVAWITKKYGPWTVQGYADPAGNNVLGSYAAPGGGGFTPDPNLVAWLGWRGEATTYIAARYQEGNVEAAKQEQSVVHYYETAINAMVMGLRTTRKLPATPPAIPS